MASRGRRNRPRRGHHHDHGGDSLGPSSMEFDSPWATAEDIAEVYDVDAAAKAALNRLTPEDVLAAIEIGGPDARSVLLREIGLQSVVRAPNRAMASQLLARLRGQSATEHRFVFSTLTLRMMSMFLQPLVPHDWEALVCGTDDEARQVVAREEHVCGHIAQDVSVTPTQVQPIALLSVIAFGAPFAAIALALLARDDEAAQRAWQALQERSAALPRPAVRSLAEVRDLIVRVQLGHEDDPHGAQPAPDAAAEADLGGDARTAAGHPGDDARGDHLEGRDVGEEPTAAQGDPATSPPVDGTPRTAAAAALAAVPGTDPSLADLEAADRLLDQAQGLADDVAGALEDGHAPAAAARDLAAALEQVEVLGVPERGARGWVAAAVERHRRREQEQARAAEQRHWLRQLAAVEGPAAVTAEVETLRASAVAALADGRADRLVSVHQFLILSQRKYAGEHVGFEDLLGAEGAAREAFPELSALLSAAPYGMVTLPVAEQTDDEATELVTDTTTPAAHAVSATDTGAVDPDMAAAGNAETAETAADPSEPLTATAPELPAAAPAPHDARQQDSAAPEEEGEEATPAQDHAGDDPDLEPAGAVPAPQQSTDQPQPTEAPAEADPIDLSDLDALLESGAAPALAPRNVPARPAQAPVPDAGHIGEPTAGPDAASTTQAPAEPPAWGTAEVSDAVTGATGDLRFGLAADVALATGAPEASVRARRAAAYAQQLRQPGGHLAAAFSEEASRLHREDLGDDRAGQLLAWAAAARVALLAPNAGPAQLLAETAPCFTDQPGITAVTEALTDASRSGLVVLPESQAAIGTVAEAEAELAAAHAAIEDILATSGRRVMNYQPANAIYQEWVSSTGDLGALLLTAATGTSADVPAAREAATALRGHAIRRAQAAMKRANKRNRIHERVLRDLHDKWEGALDAVARWCDAVTRLESSTNHAHTGEWQTAALVQVRNRLAEARDAAEADLAAAATDPHTGAAADAAAELLAVVYDALDGNAPGGPEPSPALAVHAELLALSADDLPAGLEAVTRAVLAPHVPALLELALVAPATPEAVYQRLKAAGHHDQSALLIAHTRTTAPALAATLERDRGLAVTERTAKRDAAVTALRRRLDTQRMSGALTEDDWSALSTRVDALTDPVRRDFGRIDREGQAIVDTLDELRATRIAETVERIRARAAESANVAAVSDRLTQLATDGRISSAEEYLEQAAHGGSLPEDDAEHGTGLTKFYPNVVDAFETDPKIADRLARFFRTREAGALDALASLHLEEMNRGRLEEAKRAFDGLRELRANASARALPDGSLRHILAQAGLDFARAQPEAATTGARRRWITLTGVSTTGGAPTPALGSGMSPNGTTLRLLIVWGDQQPQSLTEWMRDEPRDQTVLVLWLGRSLTRTQRRALADAARGRPRPVVAVLDEAALAYLAAQPARSVAAFAAISLPFTAASPYKDTPGDAPPEMFYGRREELEQVMDPSGPSFVSGGRQLGKSALLRAAKRRFPTTEGRVAVLRTIFNIGQDGNSATLWPALWSDLTKEGICAGPLPDGDPAEAVYNAVRAWVDADASRSLLILLDEADHFLDADAAGNRFTAVDWCRRLMLETDRRVKVVFAGLHRTARFDSLPNQPLSHLGQVTVGPLAPQHAYELITRPLAALGFLYQDPVGTPARILAMANNMPALLQLFGAALVRHLTSRPVAPGTPPELVTDEDIDTVWGDADLRRAFRDKYVLTLNLDHRYLVIAYTVAHAAHTHGVGHGLSLQQLWEEVRTTWPEGFASAGADDFRALVTECVDLGLLAHDAGGYRMRTPTVLRLLGTSEEVLDTLVTASERLAVPNTEDVGSYRRRLRDRSRSPLTERQLGDLLASFERVTVVTGSEATGIDRVAAALSEAVSDGSVTTPAKAVDVVPAPDPAMVDFHLSTAAPGTVLVLDGRGADPVTLTGLEQAARAAVPGTDTAVVLLADTSTAQAWSSLERRVPLTRVDVVGLRLLTDEEGLPFHSEHDLSALLSATGGWPALVEHALRPRPHSGPALTAGSVIDDVTEHVTARRSALARAAGLGRDPQLATVFAKVAELTSTGPEDRDTVVELVALQAAEEGATLPAEAGVEACLDALVDLGALGVTKDGRVHAEPVLTAAALAGQSA